MTKPFLLLFVISYSLSISTIGQTIVGSGSWYKSAPGPSNTEGPLITSNFDQKIITTDWWTSILWSKWQNPAGYSNRLHPHPFSYQCFSGGLGIGYGDTPNVYNGNVGTSFDNNYTFNYAEDLTIGLAGVLFSETRVEEYSDWDVLANWTNGSDVLRARMGHGFTYTYFTKEGNKDLQIYTVGTASVVGNILHIAVGKKHYAVFAPTGSKWTGNGSTFTSDLNGKSYVSVALLPDGETTTLSAFEQNAFAFITKTTSSFTIDPAGMISTHFDVTYDNKEGSASQSFFALYRHQWQYCDQINTNYTFEGPRGQMKVVEGAGFHTDMANIGTMPIFPHADNYDNSKLANLVQTFADRPSYACQGAGCNSSYYGNYTFGRFMTQAAQAALIANEIEDYDSRNKIVNWIKSELEDFFSYNDGNSHYIGYNQDWNITLINGDVSEHCSVDCLNDRHLQYGYWIRAAAVVEQFNPGWSADWGGMVELLIRDVANTDRQDDLFPFMRNYDVYAGHSWALGFSDLAEGADQESSSESLNFASALIYWGQVTNDEALTQRGMWMYTTEVVATEQYWFDVDEAVFPDTYYPEMVGLNRSSGGFYQLWWELKPEHVLMVNSFPWTGGANYLGRYPEAAQRVYEWIETGAGNNGHTKWWGYLWPYLALYNPDQAIAEYESISYDFDQEFESEANVYYWLHTLQSNGVIDKTISSNLASTIVFDKSGIKKYGAWNPSNAPIQVDFSNGKRFNCPANTLTYFTDDDAIPIIDCQGVSGGTAYIDDCGTCVGGTTGLEACPVDCDGVPNGSAVTDSCGICVDGTTGVQACTKDCNNDWGGDAYLDDCQDCVGGNTAQTACYFDCNNDLNGTAILDACGECVGGNTSQSSCLTPRYEANQYQVAVDGALTFTDASQGTIESWLWDFGSEGTVATAGPHTVTFSTPGITEVKLTVTTNGNSQQYARNIHVVGNDNCNALYNNDFEAMEPPMIFNRQLTPIENQNISSTSMTSSLSNGMLQLNSSGNEYAAAIMSLDGSINFQSNPVLGLRVKASEPMALRVTVRDQNKTLILSDQLQGDPNSYQVGTFDLPVTTDWQIFEIDFSGESMDQWIRAGNGAATSSIQDVQFIPNPVDHPAFGYSAIFNGTIDIDYLVLAGAVADCYGGTTDCFGVKDGTARIDECDWCTGGQTGVTPCHLDCYGDANGTATIDQCQNCSGGNTDISPDDCLVTGRSDSNASQLHLYPSPTSGVINVTSPLSGQLTLFNVTGRIVKTWVSSTHAMQIDVSMIPAGIYQLQMTQGDQKLTHKVIKQ